MYLLLWLFFAWIIAATPLALVLSALCRAGLQEDRHRRFVE